MQDCARKIASEDSGVGNCLGALALIGCRRKHSPHDVNGWRSTLQAISASALGYSRVTSLFPNNFVYDCMEKAPATSKIKVGNIVHTTDVLLPDRFINGRADFQ